MDVNILLRILQSFTSVNNQQRQSAEKAFNEFKSTDQYGLLTLFLDCLMLESEQSNISHDIRFLICVLLVNFSLLLS